MPKVLQGYGTKSGCFAIAAGLQQGLCWCAFTWYVWVSQAGSKDRGVSMIGCKEKCAKRAVMLPSKMSFRRRFTSLVLLGVTGIGGLSIFDDYLIFQQCSKSALNTANSDPELKSVLGENIEQGPLYAVTLGVDREGNSANCSFPVAGSLAKGNLHLRAVRFEEKHKWLTPYFPGFSGGRWEVLVLEALVATDTPPAHRRLSLIHRKSKVGDRGGGGPCGTSGPVGTQEV